MGYLAKFGGLISKRSKIEMADDKSANCEENKKKLKTPISI